jgi:hypothetical protein
MSGRQAARGSKRQFLFAQLRPTVRFEVFLSLLKRVGVTALCDAGVVLGE